MSYKPGLEISPCGSCGTETVATCANPFPFCIRCNPTKEALVSKANDMKFSKKQKDFAASDALRNEMVSVGFVVEQRKDTVRVSGSFGKIGRVWIEV